LELNITSASAIGLALAIPELIRDGADAQEAAQPGRDPSDEDGDVVPLNLLDECDERRQRRRVDDVLPPVFRQELF